MRVLAEPDREKTLLGKIILGQGENHHVLDRLSERDFSDPLMRRLFVVMRKIHRREGVAAALNGHIDISTIHSVAREAGPIDASVLVDFPDWGVTAAGAEAIVGRLQELAGLREVAALDTAAVVNGAETLADAVAIMRQNLESIEAGRRPVEGKDLGELVRDAFTAMERRHDGKESPGLMTGVHGVDQLLRGLRPGALYVVAGRPGYGKSALLTTIFGHLMAETQARAMLFSFEMTEEEVIERVLASNARIPVDQVRNGPKGDEWRRYERAAATLRSAAARGKVIDRARSVADIHSITKSEHNRERVDVVFVDYLQLVESTAKKRDNREQQVSEVARGLKRLAMDLKCAVVAAAQLNRDGERDGRPPRLSDLRESGEIEQAADAVLALHRTQSGDETREVEETIAMLLKGRNLPRDGRSLNFIGPQCRFE